MGNNVNHIDSLMQTTRDFTANALELRIFCIKPLMCAILVSRNGVEKLSVCVQKQCMCGHKQCVCASQNKWVCVPKQFSTWNCWLLIKTAFDVTLRWRNNGRDGVSNHLPYDCLLNRLFRRRWKKTSKLRVTGLCVWNSPVTGELPAQMASNAENVSIWWRHHEVMEGYLRPDFTWTWLLIHTHLLTKC